MLMKFVRYVNLIHRHELKMTKIFHCTVETTLHNTNIISHHTHTPADPPTITQSPVSQTTHLHSPVLFQCSAHGNPAPLITWNFQGSPIAGVQEGNFTVPSAGAEDVGTYSCVASNSLGQTSADATLFVLCELMMEKKVEMFYKRCQFIFMKIVCSSPLGLSIRHRADIESIYTLWS